MTTDRKALNRWAHDAGYADFDTYIRAGGSILEARAHIQDRIEQLQRGLKVLEIMTNDLAKRMEELKNAKAAAGPLEPDEPPDPHNAHPQGEQA